MLALEHQEVISSELVAKDPVFLTMFEIRIRVLDTDPDPEVPNAAFSKYLKNCLLIFVYFVKILDCFKKLLFFTSEKKKRANDTVFR
jgi:hypothetical protein